MCEIYLFCLINVKESRKSGVDRTESFYREIFLSLMLKVDVRDFTAVSDWRGGVLRTRGKCWGSIFDTSFTVWGSPSGGGVVRVSPD